MIFQNLVNFATLVKRLGVLRVVGDGSVETLETVFVLLELLESESHVEIDSGVVVYVEVVELQTLSELVNGCLEFLLFEKVARLFLELS